MRKIIRVIVFGIVFLPITPLALFVCWLMTGSLLSFKEIAKDILFKDF